MFFGLRKQTIKPFLNLFLRVIVLIHFPFFPRGSIQSRAGGPNDNVPPPPPRLPGGGLLPVTAATGLTSDGGLMDGFTPVPRQHGQEEAMCNLFVAESPSQSSPRPRCLGRSLLPAGVARFVFCYYCDYDLCCW